MFSPPDLHWIDAATPHRLAMAARPRGGEWLAEEIAAWRSAGVALVVSLLEPAEVRELELREEAALCLASGIAFASLPIPDRGTPRDATALADLVRQACGRLRAGAAVAVHCRAGIGRSGLFAACVLHALGTPFDDIFPSLGRARGVPVPDTPEQFEWVRRHAAVRAP